MATTITEPSVRSPSDIKAVEARSVEGKHIKRVETWTPLAKREGLLSSSKVNFCVQLDKGGGAAYQTLTSATKYL